MINYYQKKLIYKLCLLRNHIKKLIVIFKPYIIQFSMLFTALILLSLFIYFKFLRTRLPRDIPFNLTWLNFSILMSLSFVYLHLIFKLIKSEHSSYKIPEEIVAFYIKPIQFVLSSFHLLDKHVKYNRFTKSIYEKLLDYFLDILLKIGDIERVILYYCFKIIPSYTLLSILMVDIFYLKHLNIFYYFIFLGLLPILYNYFQYSLLRLKEKYLEHLEYEYSAVLIQDENSIYKDLSERNPDAIYHDELVTVREYFDIKVAHIITTYMTIHDKFSEQKEVDYKANPICSTMIQNKYEKEHNKKTLIFEDYDVLNKNFLKIEPKLLELMEYIILDERTKTLAYIKPIRIVLYTLYFITWSYIIYKSIHTLYEYKMILFYIKIHKIEILHKLVYPVILLALGLVRYLYIKSIQYKNDLNHCTESKKKYRE